MNWTKTTNYTTMSLVFLLAVGAFILSYVALWDIAIKHGLPEGLAWIWPLLIDGSIIVFSIAVIRAALHGERSLWPWTLIGVFTVGTVVFNALHSNQIPVAAGYVSIIVFIVPPVALVLAFETAMAMLRSTATRSSLIQSIAEIVQEMKKKQAELSDFEAKRLEEIEEKATQRQAEVETFIATRQAELDALSEEYQKRQSEVEGTQNRLNDIKRQVEATRAELEDETRDRTLVNIWDLIGHIEPTTLDTQKRQFFVALLTNAKVSQKDIAEWAGVTVKTVQRDIQGSNGLIKR